MATAPIMDNPLSPQLSPQPQMQKIVQDVIDCIIEMKNDFIENQIPINDDSQVLQRFCAKLEHLLQAEQRGKTTFLGGKKDYWNYVCDCLQGAKGLNEGIKYVKSINELKTSLGRGRALIRFALMHQRLADTLQTCIMDSRVTSDWYTSKSIWRKPKTSSAIINALYDLNDVQFDLAPSGYDLDASWPSFARKTFGSQFNWNTPSRSSSVSSLTGLGQDFPPLRLDTSNMSETSSLREEPYETFQEETEGELYAQIEKLEAEVARLHQKDAIWKDKEKQWEKELHHLKNLNAEQEITVKSLLDEVSRKTNLLHEKDTTISNLNDKVGEFESRNSTLMTKIEGLIEEKNDGASSKMDSANKAEEFLDKLNEAERKNNTLLLENAELETKVKAIEEQVKVTEEELVKCQSEFESRCQKLEAELTTEREVAEKMRLDNADFQSRLARKDALIEKQNETVLDLKYEIQVVTKRLENLEALKEEKETDLGRALQASQTLNSEIKIEIEELKSELQRRENSVEREIKTYSEKLRVLEEEKEHLQAQIESGDKERVEKQNLVMKVSDLETDKMSMGDQVKSLEDERNHLLEALQKAEAAFVEKETSLQETVNRLKGQVSEAEGKLQMSEGLVRDKEEEQKGLRTFIQELDMKLSQVEFNLNDSESELDKRDLKDAASHLQAKVENLETKLNASELVVREQKGDLDRLQGSLTVVEKREEGLMEELEGLKSLVMLLDRDDLEMTEVKDVPSVHKELVAKVEYILEEKMLNDSKVRHAEAENIELQTQVKVLKQQTEDYANELQHFQLENAELKTVVSQLQNAEAEITRKLEMRIEIIDEQNNEIKKFEARMQESGKTVEAMEGEMVRLEAATSDAMMQVKELQKDNERKEADIENLRVDITEQIGMIDKLRTMIQDMDTEISGRDQRISQLDLMNKRLANEMKLLQDLVATANDSSTRFEKQIRSFEERITIMSTSFESLQHDNERLLADKGRLMQENSRLQTQIETVTEERKRLEDEQDMLEKSLIAAFEEKLAIVEGKYNREQEKCDTLQKQLDKISGDSSNSLAGDTNTCDVSVCSKSSHEESSQTENDAVQSATGVHVCSQSGNLGTAVEKDNIQTSGATSEKQMDEIVSHYKNELQRALDENREVSSHFDELKTSFESLKEESSRSKQSVSSLEKQRDDVKSEFDKLNSVIENICEENERLKTMVSEKDNEVVDLSQMISDLEEEKVKLSQSLLGVHKERDELDSRLTNERSALQTAEAGRTELEEQLSNIRLCAKAESEKLQEKCDELVMKLLEVTKENEEVRQKMKDEESNKEELQSTLKQLEEKLASVAIETDRSTSVASGEVVVREEMEKVTVESPDMLDGMCKDRVSSDDDKWSDCKTDREQLQKSAAGSDVVEDEEEDRFEVYVNEPAEVKVNEAALIESLEDEILDLKQQNYDLEMSLKYYVNQGMDVAKMLDRMSDQETLIQTLELELQEIRDEREIERDRQWNELEILKDSLLNREEESRLLGEEVKRTSLLLDGEREAVVKLKNEMQELKKKHEDLFSKKEQELLQEVATSVELKKKLIKLIKEKDTLWKKTDHLEYKQRVKAAETWMNDTDVLHCLGCRAEFSFMLRKHHCRLCGRIYCHNCSNNWVLTTHTKGKSRVCNACFIERESGSKENDKNAGSDIDDDASVQVPSLRSDSWRSSVCSTPDPLVTSAKLPGNMRAESATPNSTIDSASSSPCSPKTNDLHSDQDNFVPSPDVHMIIASDPQNKTDDSKLELNVTEEPSPEDFNATTDDLTSNIKVEVDGEEVDGDKDDVFHLISDEEIARSLSHSHSDYLAEHEESLTTSVTLSVDAISKNVEKEHEETTIKPGHMFAVPVLIDSSGITLCWEFSTNPKSITFSINYKENETTPPDQQQVLFTPCKCNSHRQMVQGELVAQKAGIYTLFFDNAHSRYTSKQLKYKLQVKAPM